MQMKLSHGIPLLALVAGVQNALADVTANPDTASTVINQSVLIDVGDNDVKTGNFYQLTNSFPITTSNGGTVSYVGYGGVVTYQPPADFTGEDTFSYFAEDGIGYGDTALVTVSVRSADDGEGPIESGVTGTNKKKTARMLDGLCASPPNEMSEEFSAALSELCAVDPNRYNDIIAEITPEEILVLRHMMSNISQGHSQRLYQHQDSLRSGRGNNVVAVNGNALMLQSYRGGAAGEAQSSPWGIFGSVHSDNADHDQTDFESEYESTGYGLTVGVDYRLSPSLFVGGAMDFSTFDVDYTSDAGTVKSDIYGYS